MPYLLLIHEPHGQRLARTEAEGKAVYERMVRFAEDLKKQGKLLAVESLTAPSEGVSVQVRGGGKPAVLDGPFAEAKEFVGGFFLLDCQTREEAVAIAGKCPAAEWATVEVRATGPCFE
ncbi:MAG: YciI family protein [Pseudomonadota bacterium]